jgi:hypothetical protein
MTGLAARGVGSIRLVRTGIELGALAVGWLLGGSVGLGTVVFAVTIGPLVQFFLPRLTVGAPRSPVDRTDPLAELDAVDELDPVVDPLSGAAEVRPAVEG